MHRNKSAASTTTGKHASDSTTNRRSKNSVAQKYVEKKQDSTTSTNENDGPVIQGRASNLVTSTKRLTQTKTSLPVAKTTKTAASKSSSASKNDRTSLLATTSQVKADGVRKTTSDKLGKPTKSLNDKSTGKQQLVKGHVRNFNNNAADTKWQAIESKGRRVRQTSADEVNRNWNAGDTETAEPAAAVVPQRETIAVPADTVRKVSIALPAGAGVFDDDESSYGDEEVQRSPSQEKIAKLRRLSAIEDTSDHVESTKLKPTKTRKASTPYVCIRRCIAEDETWDLKTVPDLDMLIVKYFAENYAGVETRKARESNEGLQLHCGVESNGLEWKSAWYVIMENPRDLNELPAVYKAAVLRRLSPELPLEIVVDRIDDEEYWQRRCDLSWDLSKVLDCVTAV